MTGAAPADPHRQGPVVVLIGPMGAGKTTVAEALAARLGWPVRDTDADVERITGRRITDIFVEHGEPAFRRLEHEAVVAALAEHTGVLALGGGAVLDERTQELLTGHRVIFLDVHIKDAAQRIGLNRDRPLLLGNPRAEWTRLMDQRRAIYHRLASHVVGTDGRTPEQVVAEVLTVLGDEVPAAARPRPGSEPSDRATDQASDQLAEQCGELREASHPVAEGAP